LTPRDWCLFDETCTSTAMVRLRGRSPRGERLVGYAPHGHRKTITTFVAALRQRGMTAPLVLDGAMNGPMFLAYVKQCLAPTLKRGDIVIMDNLPVHKVAGVQEAIEGAGAKLLYEPGQHQRCDQRPGRAGAMRMNWLGIPGRPRRQCTSRGFILVAALWILAALATLAVIFSIYLARTAVSLSMNDSDVQTEALVYASLELTAYQVSSPKTADSPAGAAAGAPGSPGAAQLGASSASAPQARNPDVPPPPARGDFSFRLGRANVAVTFIPETARIDINAASPQLLTNFFTVLGAPRQQAEQYVQRIAGWVTAPKATQQQAVIPADNTEEALYRAAGRTYGPRGAPFAHIDELSLVVDIPPAIVERAKPFLTVYTGKAQIDVLDAAPEVVAAIPGLTPNLLQSLAEARQTGADPQAVSRLLGALPLQGVVSIEGGDTYRVQVRIRYDNGRQAAAEVVIRTAGNDKPYGVLWWRDGFDALSNTGLQPGLLPTR
jgi:general secretion pathway protein K